MIWLTCEWKVMSKCCTKWWNHHITYSLCVIVFGSHENIKICLKVNELKSDISRRRWRKFSSRLSTSSVQRVGKFDESLSWAGRACSQFAVVQDRCRTASVVSQTAIFLAILFYSLFVILLTYFIVWPLLMLTHWLYWMTEAWKQLFSCTQQYRTHSAH